MKLQNIYSKDINRNINGVIKADQNDDANLEQEFSEYIVTKELRKHFDAFYSRYAKSIDEPTDDVGVWISGFFGSGKSHFLKILSYLLENKEIAGKKAVDYFENKIDDPMMFATMENCCKIPTESILFNIDVKSSVEKDKTAILKVFAKVFYEHLGYFGRDIKVARFEQFLDRNGKLDAFKTKFEEIHGDSWEESRDAFEIWQEDITEAMADVLNTSITSANNWFENNDISGYGIDVLIEDIKKYIDSKGDKFRLIFCVDEIGQYMGSDGNLILNLQSIVEEIGTKCYGRVWVIVTSQEAIDAVTKVNAQAFSKIQGRFKTRLSLTSSSVDEVIKKRILAKNESAELLLEQKYNDNSSVLKNLISFHDARGDLKGYSDAQNFIQTYPFIPYQFILFQDVLVEIRQHGNAGQHQSSGERSMLSGFQEVAQQLNDRDENALVPFWLFYNSVNSFLESTIRRVIDRCQSAYEAGDGIEEYDVSVLKLLYLIKYIKDIPSTVENIATLMADSIDVDKIELKNKVKESLDRLIAQNYIAKSGNTYTFLTDDEQEIEKAIKNTVVDSANIIAAIQKTVFEDLYMNKQITVGDNSIGFDKYVDDVVYGNITNSIDLRLITTASDLSKAADATLIIQSEANNEAICVLSDSYNYYEELEAAAKTIKYIKGVNVSQMPSAIQDIISKKRREATENEKHAKEQIANAIINGSFYIAGTKAQLPGTTVKDKFNAALTSLVDSVYSKMNLVKKHYGSDADILEIFNANNQISFGNTNPNSEAVEDVALWIDTRFQRRMPVVMSDVMKQYKGVPYGWSEPDIAAMIACLIMDKRINVVYGGAVYQNRDSRLIELLRKKTEIDKTRLEKREEIDVKLIKQVKDFLIEYLDIMNISDDEDELAQRVVDELTKIKDECNGRISRNYTTGKGYPGLSTLSTNVRVIDDVLKQHKDNTALFKKLLEVQDELLDLDDDKNEVFRFLDSQRPVFDKGKSYLAIIKNEEVYLESNEDVTEKIKVLEDIITSDKPYRRINEIPTLVDDIKRIYDTLLDNKRTELHEFVEDAAKEIVDAADGDAENKVVKKAEQNLNFWNKRIGEEESIVKLDAMKAQITSKKQDFIIEIFDEIEVEGGDGGEDIPPVPEKAVAKVSRNTIATSAKLTTNEEIDEYVARIASFLKKKLAENDEIQII